MKNVTVAITSCLPSSSDITYSAMYGFRNAKEMDKYSFLAKTKYIDYYDIVHIYPFSCHNLLQNSPNQLFKAILDDKPLVPLDFPK